MGSCYIGKFFGINNDSGLEREYPHYLEDRARKLRLSLIKVDFTSKEAQTCLIKLIAQNNVFLVFSYLFTNKSLLFSLFLNSI